MNQTTWPSMTVIPGFSLLEIHDQEFCSLLDMCMFRNGTSSIRKDSVYVGTMIVAL
jgi:hypothetical protein